MVGFNFQETVNPYRKIGLVSFLHLQSTTYSYRFANFPFAIVFKGNCKGMYICDSK